MLVLIRSTNYYNWFIIFLWLSVYHSYSSGNRFSYLLIFKDILMSNYNYSFHDRETIQCWIKNNIKQDAQDANRVTQILSSAI